MGEPPWGDRTRSRRLGTSGYVVTRGRLSRSKSLTAIELPSSAWRKCFSSGVGRGHVRGGGQHNSASVPNVRREPRVERVAQVVALGRRHADDGVGERGRLVELDVPPCVEVGVLEGELDRVDLDVDEAGVLE